MRKKFTSILLLCLSISLISIVPVHTQNDPAYSEGPNGNIHNKEGNYLRFQIRNQVAARVIQPNPGQISVQPFAADSHQNRHALLQDAHLRGIANNFFIPSQHVRAFFLYSRRPLLFAIDLNEHYEAAFNMPLTRFCTHSFLPPVICT